MHHDGPFNGPETTPGTAATPPGYGSDGLTDRAVGSVVAEDYRIEGRLGMGGMGVVYLARHQTLDRRVAIKELLTASPQGRERLLREAMAMARLDHPNVVRVFDARKLDGHLFIVMEYVAGGTLQQWCASRRRSVKEILHVFAAAAQGLAAAHAQGIVHRDFKPQNVLMTPEGIPRVADFGIARAGEAVPSTIHPPGPGPVGGPLDSDLTATGSMLGTPAYMAPEQYEGRADARSDQFAFCVALYEALYSQRPFTGGTPAALWTQKSRGEIAAPPASTDVPQSVFEVLRRGLDPKPERRFANLPRVVRALPRADASRAPLIAAVTVAAILVVGGLSIGGWWLSQSSEPSESPSVSSVVAGPDVARPSPPSDSPPNLDLGEVDEWLDVPASKPIVGKFAPFPVAGEPVALKESIVCDGVTSYQNMKWTFDQDEPMIIAKEDCNFVCRDCDVEAKQVILAWGSGRVEFEGGEFVAWDRAATVRDNGEVVLRDLEVKAVGASPAYFVEDDAQLTLERVTTTAKGGIQAMDDATVRLDRSTVVAGDYSIKTAQDVTVQDFESEFLGPKWITGTIETIQRAR